MKLVTIKCTNCGSINVRLNPDGKTASCDRCYSDFIVEQGRKFGDVDSERAEQISRLRRTMLQLATECEYENCSHVATDILGMIPGDFMATFCLYYSNKCRHADPRKYEGFLADPGTPMGVEGEQAMRLILSRLELREVKSVGRFIDAAFAEDEKSCQKWRAALDRREKEESAKTDQYSKYPRDVFICYSTRDESIALKIVEVLEKDNRSCWIATRNLRDDATRYWPDIEYAIENCTILLVLTSEASMHSKDVEHEILFAIKRGKEHFEFKLDNSERTAAFKNYFDGITWVEGVGCTEDQLQRLKERVVLEWKAVKVRANAAVSFGTVSPKPIPQQPLPIDVGKAETVRKTETVRKPLPESADPPKDPSVLYELGNMYYTGRGVPQDYVKAFECYEKAAVQWYSFAQNMLGFMYHHGQGVPQNYAEALKWYEKAAVQGLNEAQYNLGCMHANGQGVPQDYGKALEWYIKAAVQENSAAQYNLGCMYANGQGAPQDYKKAREWLEKAAEQDYPPAQNMLGLMYCNMQGVPRDYAKACEWFERAALQGFDAAQNNLGFMYARGLGVAQDYVKARDWYERAAVQGHASAQDSLGDIYYYGQGVPQDYVKARKWFEASAAQGYSFAQNNLGMLYDEGHGVPQDYVKACELFENAAMQGNSSAQYNLGRMYAEGHGVLQDYAKACEWFERAAAQGHALAKKTLSRKPRQGLLSKLFHNT